MSTCRTRGALLASAALTFASACHSSKPPVILPPPPLSESAASAVRWIDAHAVPIPIPDSLHPAPSSDFAPIVAFVGDARILGISELTEGTHQFTAMMQTILATLTDHGFRGIAVQASMADAMELDRYVRTGTGNPRQWLRTLGLHWNTQELLSLVEWMREYDRTRPTAEQVGFYGFELPNAAHALQVVNGLPDSVAGTNLKAYIRRELQCVSMGESAAWGRAGPASDSTFWNRCRGATAGVVDSLGALRARLASRPSAQAMAAFAEQMAMVTQHDADVGLRKLPRHETVADHILWLANSLGPDAKLLVWGRDVESGRLTGEGGVVQSAVPLSTKLGERYRNLAFTASEGVVRAQPINPGQREPGGETNMRLRAARPESYEDILNHAAGETVMIDMRAIGTDSTAAWLRGPHPARLVSGIYSENLLGSFETPLQIPGYYDGLLFAKHVTPTTPLKR